MIAQIMVQLADEFPQLRPRYVWLSLHVGRAARRPALAERI
jgi:hypothetical protein